MTIVAVMIILYFVDCETVQREKMDRKPLLKCNIISPKYEI